MKIKYLIVLLMAFAGIILAQNKTNYPHVSIYDIQHTTDTTGTGPSLYSGDTVVVTGIVMAQTVDQYHRPILWAGARWQTYLKDTADVNGFSGINIIQNDSTTLTSNLDLIDTAQVVSITGVVTEYLNAQTEIIVIPSIPTTFDGSVPNRGNPIVLNVSDFVTGGSTPTYLKSAEKYEGMYVEFHNVISSDRNISTSAANPFAINDENGNKLLVHGQSGYFTKRNFKLREWDPPVDGTAIPYIRGVIGQNSDGSWVIRPIYPVDMQLGQAPPVISNMKRNIVNVGPNDSVQVTAKILDLDLGGTIPAAKLYYSVNNGPNIAVNMTAGADSVWSGKIPKVSDSSLVSYFIWAQDNDMKTSIYPADTAKGKYFYLVLNRPLTIQDVEYSPFGGGYGGYTNYRVTVSGIVTADTSDFQGDGNQVPRRAVIQNGEGPWSGLQVSGLMADQLRRGQDVTISGLIMEANGTTKIDSITSVVLNSSNNALPAPHYILTSDIGTLANGTLVPEQWENVYVAYKDVKVTNENADGNPGPLATGNNNYGEILIADTSHVNTRVELQEGNHPYHNLWDSALVNIPGNIRLKAGDKFSELRGVLYYAFSNYKLVPRKTDDFVGYVQDVKDNNLSTVNSYKLNQNYPNPFNPTTNISYTIPQNGFVSIKVYNILGREVKSLVNQEQRAGSYNISFDASRLSSGVYFYQIRINNYTASKKMVLLK